MTGLSVCGVAYTASWVGAVILPRAGFPRTFELAERDPDLPFALAQRLARRFGQRMQHELRYLRGLDLVAFHEPSGFDDARVQGLLLAAVTVPAVEVPRHGPALRVSGLPEPLIELFSAGASPAALQAAADAWELATRERVVA